MMAGKTNRGRQAIASGNMSARIGGVNRRDTIHYYDAISNGYDELYGGEQTEKYARIMSIVIGLPHSIILDMGCGTGLFFQYLEKQGVRPKYYVCTDISRGMLYRFLEKTIGGARVPVDPVRADARRPPFRDSSFDLTVSVTMFNNLEENEVREAIGLLKSLARHLTVISLLETHATEMHVKEVEYVCGRPIAVAVRDLIFACPPHDSTLYIETHVK